MLTVRDRFPEFDLPAVVGTDEPELTRVCRADYAGSWLVVFSWPMDFTTVCPTEIVGFGRAEARFAQLGAALLGFSIDSEHAHLAWRRTQPHLRHLPVPLAADVKRELASALGVLDPETGVALRATFIVDPDGMIRFVSVHDLATGRSVDEVVRTLEALQRGEPTPCGWRPGDDTLAS